MTPDELRRMDNDQCIIYEKGIKPVKAQKFYYFKHSMAKKMKPFEVSHNDIGVKDRGVWRKYNPYNPYVEEKDEKAVENLKVESLDDLFDDSIDEKEERKPTIQKEKQNAEKSEIDMTSKLKIESPSPVSATTTSTVKPIAPVLDLEDFIDDAPILPQREPEQEKGENDDTYDLQKELEAKFDELFGPIDD